MNVPSLQACRFRRGEIGSDFVFTHVVKTPVEHDEVPGLSRAVRLRRQGREWFGLSLEWSGGRSEFRTMTLTGSALGGLFLLSLCSLSGFWKSGGRCLCVFRQGTPGGFGVVRGCGGRPLRASVADRSVSPGECRRLNVSSANCSPARWNTAAFCLRGVRRLLPVSVRRGSGRPGPASRAYGAGPAGAAASGAVRNRRNGRAGAHGAALRPVLPNGSAQFTPALMCRAFSSCRRMACMTLVILSPGLIPTWSRRMFFARWNTCIASAWRPSA